MSKLRSKTQWLVHCGFVGFFFFFLNEFHVGRLLHYHIGNVNLKGQGN